jgi:peptidyl-prolyl cis-trans isomerase D
LNEGIPPMMEALRNGAKSWVAKVLLGLLIASFAVWGITDVFRGFQTADLVEVGGKGISSELFRKDLNDTLQQINSRSGSKLTIEDAKTMGIDKQVLDRLISQAALNAQAERLGVMIGDKAVANEVQTNPAFLDSKGVFNVDQFRSVLQQNGLNEPAFIARERQGLMIRSLTGVAGDNTTLPRTMVEAMTRYREETRDARFVTFSVTETDVPPPTAEDLKKQYEATPAAYTAPEYRAIAVLKVEPLDVAAKIQVSDQEIADLYEKSKEDYFQPETRDIIQVSFPDVAAAEKAKARIDGGEDIVKVAAELGQKEKDINFAGKTKADFLDEKISEAAFALAEGAVSTPVKGSLNTALLKAVKIVPAKQPTLAEISPKLKERLQMEKAQEEIQSVYEAVEDARAQQTKLEDIAAKAGLPVLVIPAISQAGVDKAGQPVTVPAQQELLQAVFSSDVGLDTDALQANDGYVWYDVREVIPSAVKPYDMVKDQVKADWTAMKLRTLAADKAKAIVEKAGSTTKFESIATELGGAIKTATGLKRNNVSEDFDGVATLALFGVPEKALTWSLEGDGKSARIIEVTKVSAPVGGMSTAAADVSKIAKEGLAGDLLETYQSAAKSGTDVTMNEELWRQISGTATTP